MRNEAKLALALQAVLVLGAGDAAQSHEKFSREHASFRVKVKNEILIFKVQAVFVLPQEELAIEVLTGTPLTYDVTTTGGNLVPLTRGRWRWQSPIDPGIYPISIRHKKTGEAVLLNAIVMLPYTEVVGEHLNGFQIGKYPSIPLKQLPIYRPPKGFVEVTRENEDTLLSPHFKLRQFLCKQDGGYPKYLVLREQLILKLELILEKANESGHKCSTFFVMSGYRTPFYNKAIGNVKYSRHLWGGAADIFIDERPRDGYMDDLNLDGKIDFKDAAMIYDLIDEMFGKSWYGPFVGGLGRYGKTANHGPFVHVDVRGSRARWGK